jgi:CheY-like chemotaxis protein
MTTMPKRKVLLVDDSEIVREMVRLTLTEHGYTVVTLDGPFGFSRVLLDEKPDLVLMDVSMPALRGHRLAEVAQRSALHSCPIVLFSTHPEEELAALVASSGVTGYIRKTGNADLLLHEIERFIREFHSAP